MYPILLINGCGFWWSGNKGMYYISYNNISYNNISYLFCLRNGSCRIFYFGYHFRLIELFSPLTNYRLTDSQLLVNFPNLRWGCIAVGYETVTLQENRFWDAKLRQRKRKRISYAGNIYHVLLSVRCRVLCFHSAAVVLPHLLSCEVNEEPLRPPPRTDLFHKGWPSPLKWCRGKPSALSKSCCLRIVH